MCHSTEYAHLQPDPPRPTVQLTGKDGNIFAILGAVSQALRDAGATPEYVAQFIAESTAGDYDHALATAMKYADVS